METEIDFISLGPKITADGDCSHEIKRYLLLGRKAMTNLYSILKSRGITFPTEVCLVKAMVFPFALADRESACNEGDLGSIPALGRSPGEGNGKPLWYSSLENPTDGEVHGVKE